MPVDKFAASEASKLKILIFNNEIGVKPITVFYIATPL